MKFKDKKKKTILNRVVSTALAVFMAFTSVWLLCFHNKFEWWYIPCSTIVLIISFYIVMNDFFPKSKVADKVNPWVEWFMEAWGCIGCVLAGLAFLSLIIHGLVMLTS